MKQPSRQRVSTGSPFEPKVGISRAVRSGNIIAVTGTAPLGKDGKTVAKGDAAGQARRCLQIIQSAIEGLDPVFRVNPYYAKRQRLPGAASRPSVEVILKNCGSG